MTQWVPLGIDSAKKENINRISDGDQNKKISIIKKDT